MTKSKTFKQVAAELTENQIGIKRVAGEYKVWPKAENCGGLGTYFTDDLHDAHMTGLSMAKDAGTLVTRVERTDLAPAVKMVAASLPDELVITSLRQLNDLLKPVAEGWTIRRSPAGYYYYTHDEKINTLSGTYVFSCKGTTLGFWRRELAAVIAEAR